MKIYHTFLIINTPRPLLLPPPVHPKPKRNFFQNQLPSTREKKNFQRTMLNFTFSGKRLGLVSPPHFMYGFSRKMFFMLYSLNWSISWLDCLYFSRYLTITVPDCDVINFGINLIFLIKAFCYKTKKSRQKIKYF